MTTGSSTLIKGRTMKSDGPPDIKAELDAELMKLGNGRITRRDFVQKAGLLGLSVPAIGRLLASHSASTQRSAGLDTRESLRTGTGTLIYGNPEPPTSARWDPQAAFGLADQQTWSMVYDTLLTNDSQGNILPHLATSWKLTSPTTIEMTLRRGVHFHDGTPLTANDVKATLERVANPVNSDLAYSSFVIPLTVHVVDDYHFTIVLSKPYGPFTNSLVLLSIIRAKDAANPTIFKSAAIGSGPFRFTRYVNNSIYLTANKNYWGGPVGPAAVTLTYIEDPDARRNALLTGEVNVFTRASSIDLDAVAGNSAYRVTTVSPVSQYLYLLQFNTPLKDVRLRQALAYAVDRRTIATKIIQIDPPAMSSLTATTLGFRPLEPFDYLPTKARELVKAAGYPHGLDLTFATSALMPHQMDIDQLVAGTYLADVGIRTSLRTLETGAFRSDWPQYAISFNTIGIAGKDPDPLVSFFSPGTTKAVLHFVDPKLTQLLDNERFTEGSGRLTAINQLAEYLWDNQTCLFIADDVWHTIYSSKWKYERAPLSGEPLAWHVAMT